jgi:hypothetical protein
MIYSKCVNKTLCVSILFLSALALTPAQQRGGELVFAFAGVYAKNDTFTSAQIRVMENRVTTALVRVAEHYGYSLVIPRNRDALLKAVYEETGPEISLSRMVTAHGVVTGELTVDDARHYLDLHLLRTETGETLFTVSRDFDSFETALDGAGPALARLFGTSYPERAGHTSDPERKESVTTGENTDRYAVSPTLTDLHGKWQADAGFETVEIKPDGTGRVFVTDYDYMQIRVSIEDATIIVRQDEPNSPKLYLGAVPYAIAVQIAPLARPMRWIFQLTADRRTLEGIQETSYLQIEDGRVLRVDNSHTRSSTWLRLE